MYEAFCNKNLCDVYFYWQHTSKRPKHTKKQVIEIVFFRFFCAAGRDWTTAQILHYVLFRLLREPKLISKMQHQNIVYSHGIVKWNNCIGVVMELVEGECMQDLLTCRTVKNISWDLRLRIAKELSDALSYLHQHSTTVCLVHGDLKPEKVLLTKNLHVKLTTFCSSDVMNAATDAPISLGMELSMQCTNLYAAPEVMENPNTKRQTFMDIYR